MKLLHPPQFAMWMLLFACTVVAGYFAGYNTGDRQNAVADAQQTVSTRIYPLRDVVSDAPNPRRELENIIRLIKATVDPDSWYEPGVDARAYEAKKSIVVQQTYATHSKIDQLLTGLREMLAARKSEMVWDRPFPLPMNDVLFRPARLDAPQPGGNSVG